MTIFLSFHKNRWNSNITLEYNGLDMHLYFDRKIWLYPLLSVQIPVVSICCAAFLVWQPTGLMLCSTLSGGFVVLLSQILFSYNALHKTGAQCRQRILVCFYWATALKWLSVVLSSLLLFYCMKLLAFPFFLTYIIAQLAMIISLYWQASSSVQVSMHG